MKKLFEIIEEIEESNNELSLHGIVPWRCELHSRIEGLCKEAKEILGGQEDET